MRLPQASPGEGPRSDYEHFTYWSIGGGEKHHAYIAGPCQWFVCHPSERTKPCLRWISQDALPCKYCANKKDRAQCGYLPLWRGTDWRPKLAVVYEPEREHIGPMANHTRVLVGRESERGAALFVRKAVCQEPAFCTTNEKRQRPQDIWRCLLMLWAIPELTSYFASVGEPECVTEVPPAEPVKSDGRPFDEMHAAAARRFAPPPDRVTSADELFDAARQALQMKAAKNLPSANGKHKPKG